MATIDEAPRSPTSEVTPMANPLNGLLTRFYALDWATVYYVGIFVLAVLSRFINLGDRVMSHDESLHVKYSYDLYKGNGFQHTPLMHGPLLFHMTALSYFLFGDSDFTARLYPAILGIIMVMMPKLLFERWLGKRGAMAASFMLLISPMVLFHNRYIREDTPSIFFSLLMVFAILAYLDGQRPKQIRWLVLLSGATVLSLASKEIAFMYIAIFGSFLTLFWLVQVIQGVRSGAAKPIIGWVLGVVVGLIGIAGVSLEAGILISGKLAVNADGNKVSAGLIAIPIAVVLLVASVILLGPIRRLLGEVSIRANSLFKLVSAGILIGVVASLLMTCVLNIDKPSEIWTTAPAPNAAAVQPVQPGQPAQAPSAADTVTTTNSPLLNRLIIWTVLVIVVLALIAIVPALVRFSASPNLPWVDLALVVAVAFIVGFVLTYLEQRSLDSTTTTPGSINNSFIAAAWVVGILGVGGILLLRFGTNFFEEMRRYAVFDVLIVLGSLVLPWLAAFPVFLAGYSLDGGGSSYTPDTINACILSVIPLAAISIAAGLSWNPTAWLLCAGTFYSLFVFFFTTVFTNMNGLATGLVGSLGYWLAQQGVRRGSQPQYFYFMQVIIYEYLPAIGAIIAGIVGMLGLWRFRETRIAEVRAMRLQAITEPPLDISQQEIAQEVMTDEGAPDPAMIQQYQTEPEAPVEAAAPTDMLATTSDSDFMQAVEQSAELNPELNPVIEMPTPPKYQPNVPLEFFVPPDSTIAPDEVLSRLPVLAFVGYWAALLFFGLTVAGEKMPWMTTHLTVPMIFITGWYIGTILDQIEWGKFFKQSWAIIVLAPLFLIGLANVIGLLLGPDRPFSGLTREQLLQTFLWFGAILVTGMIGYVIYRIQQRIGIKQLIRVTAFAVFIFLCVITARTAWRAAYIDYDYATEFMVYAHGAPSNKIIMNYLDDIASRSSDGRNIKVAYDDKMSWPGTWYFRNFPNATFLGDPSGRTDLTDFVAIAVGQDNNAKVQDQLQADYVSMRYSRLWWPMQDYFDMSVSKIDNAFALNETNLDAGWVDPAKLRAGLWDIWWNRDYTTYGDAVSRDFKVSNWPVTDWMYFYVRKDVAAQIWNLGTGATVKPVSTDPIPLKCPTCLPSAIYSATSDPQLVMNQPHGLSVAPDGNLYVADTENSRVIELDASGKFMRQIGNAPVPDTVNPVPSGTFRKPWDVAVGADGTIFVADTWAHRVQVFDKNGTFKTSWGEFIQVAPGSSGAPDAFYGPRAITLDAQGNVYVADTGNKRIRVYTPGGQLLRDIGQSGTQNGQLNEPVGLAIDNNASELYVADSWNKRIQVFDLNTGAYKRSWPIQGWAASTNDTGTRPFIALDPTNTHLFITVPDLGKVLVYDTQGNGVVTFGTLGHAPFSSNNQTAALGGIKVDSNGHLIMTDPATGRIIVYDYLQIPGIVPQQMMNPNQPNQPNQAATAAATSSDF